MLLYHWIYSLLLTTKLDSTNSVFSQTTSIIKDLIYNEDYIFSKINTFKICTVNLNHEAKINIQEFNGANFKDVLLFMQTN